MRSSRQRSTRLGGSDPVPLSVKLSPKEEVRLIRRELRAFGYVEGKNIAFEYRSAEGEPNRLAALADELVRLKVDVLVMSTPEAVLAAKKATTTIPIIFLLAGDPVAVWVR